MQGLKGGHAQSHKYSMLTISKGRCHELWKRHCFCGAICKQAVSNPLAIFQMSLLQIYRLSKECRAQKRHQELRSWAQTIQVGQLCTDGLHENLETPNLDLLRRSKAFLLPSTPVQVHELLAVATSKADMKLKAPVTRKQQRFQQQGIDLCLHLPFQLVKVSDVS